MFETASSILKINYNSLQENYKYLGAQSSPARAAPVVKANGYGLGIEHVIKALEPLNPPFYFVATLEEALAARAYTQKPIATLNGLFKGSEALYAQNNFMPVCGSVDDIDRAAEFNIKTIWQIDTGMNRMGVRFDELETLKYKNPPFIILSHFISSEEPQNLLNNIQIERFNHAQKFLKTLYKDSLFSLANSSGIFLPQKPLYDITRPGVALYGVNPTPLLKNPMQPVVTLQTRVLRIDNAATNESAGYNATYVFKKPSKLATVSLGYADGIFRTLSNNFSLYWQGIPLPVRGRVSMDLCIVDLSELPPHIKPPEIGNFLDVLNDIQTVDLLAGQAGTIAYEILTSLSKRATRVAESIK